MKVALPLQGAQLDRWESWLESAVQVTIASASKIHAAQWSGRIDSMVAPDDRSPGRNHPSELIQRRIALSAAARSTEKGSTHSARSTGSTGVSTSITAPQKPHFGA